MSFIPEGEDSPIAETIGNYKLIREIGVGSFSIVWLARNLKADLDVAIKIIPKKRIATDVNIIRFERETNFLKQLDHPLIAQYFEHLEDDNYHYFVMELAPNGDLLAAVNRQGKMDEQQAKLYFAQLIVVLDYLHNDMLVAHRDLKAENVLLDKNENIRLIDFGFSRSFTADDPNLNTTCGSPAYVPPEMIKREAYTVQADVWSTGILLYSLVVGRLPFEDSENNVQKILQKIAYSEPFYPRFISPDLKDLLTKMLTKQPDKRITIAEIRKHPWFPAPIAAELEKFTKNNSGSSQSLESFKYDEDVAKECSNCGIDTTTLQQRLIAHEFDSETAIYLMYRKRKITNLLHGVIKQGVSNEVKRSTSLTNVTGNSNTPKIVRRKLPSRSTTQPIH
ncbi:CAMK family protein kinase [Trichomonas vaginalis G3]|uniref:non-specific serine/threonine protein kinase n=1 Tax=Trichomonas vaginalis (strain ATCC PRA-98 / G3) TaxID=412133 RepID=A2ECN9_TRIV3|nr:protein serine/threonine kinase protein [Trichomonas vaginalis G3]EAY09535.1 CAMK family protein kinase [Trichomonas vaginalis G3]KAI5533161.1 protein serine/threonine kinase protein [Trichomonas vaginalis G3]|eukprot:XP_001321758.1 CAMK family protein kinase [Trichomonas vaginalis G3]